MKTTVIILACVAFASAQFFDYNQYLTSTTEPTRPIWNGPLANHISGQPPPDTPEVSAAKAQLQQAYSEVLKVLPLLPQEPVKPVVLPQQPQYIPQHIPQQPQQYVPQHISQQIPQFIEPAKPVPTFTQYAEEIPLSPLGEVPEVYAARIAHMKAYEAARASLPITA